MKTNNFKFLTRESLSEIKEDADRAQEILDSLHIHHIDYITEYITFTNSNINIYTLLGYIDRLEEEINNLNSQISNPKSDMVLERELEALKQFYSEASSIEQLKQVSVELDILSKFIDIENKLNLKGDSK